MKETSIECKKIRKFYGTGENQVQALKNISLEIYQNQLTLLVGPSGSGKTTLLSIITSILTPDEGQLFLLGQEIGKMSEKERSKFCRDHLGIVFQSLFLIPTLSVAENIALPLIVKGISHDIANVKAMEMLKRMHLEHRSEASPAVLSKGQQQRVAIGRAIINDSNILVCDEPTSALDQAAGFEIMTLLRDLAIHHSKTVLVVTHDHRIFHFADRIINMNDGEIVTENNHD